MATDEHGGDLPYEEGDAVHYPMLGCPDCPASFFKGEDYTSHRKERHSDQPRSMAWMSGEHKISYYYKLWPSADHYYTLEDSDGKVLSNLALKNDGTVDGVETHPQHRRQGLATKLWNEAHANAQRQPGVPVPQHSQSRTRAGDAWARSLGAAKTTNSLLSARQMQGMIDFKRQ